MIGSKRSMKRVGGSPTARGIAAVLIVMAMAVVVARTEAASAASSSLTRYPYVTDVVGNSVRINWATDTTQTTGTATWGAVSGGTCPSTLTNSVTATNTAFTGFGSKSEYQWTATVSFPSSGTYCYRVQGLGATDLLGTDASPQVTTAAAPGTSYSFAVVGDWGAGTTDEANVMGQIAKSPANFVVTVGDNDYNNGTQDEYGDLAGGNVFPSKYLPALGQRPIYAAEGNHGFTQYQAYIQNFPGLTAAQASGGRFTAESYCCISTLSGAHTYPSTWYAFDWGSARYYVLDGAWADSQGAYQGDFLAHWNGAVSGCTPCGAELTWLQSDLAAHAGTPLKFAFFHYPLYSDNSGQASDTYLDGSSSLEGLLANNNVDVVFNGHAHGYERNLPQIPGKPMVSYVTGGGGDALGGISSCSPFDAYALGGGMTSCNATAVPDANVFNFLLVNVNGNKVTVTPTDSTGRTFDVQTYTYSIPPALTIAKAHVGSFVSGSNAAYNLTVSNSGGPTSGTVTVSDTLPAGETFVSGSGGGFSCSAVAQAVTCTSSTPIVSGSPVTISLNVKVTASAGTVLSNQASVSPNGGNSNVDQVSVSPPVLPPPALSTVAVSSTDVIAVGRSPLNALWYQQSSGGGATWSGWQSVAVTDVASQPAVVNNGGVLSVFFRATDNEIHYVVDTGGTWGTEQNLGGVLAGNPAAAVDGNGRIVVAGLNGAGNVFTDMLPSGGSWTGWTSLAGVLSGQISLATLGGNVYLLGVNSAGLGWTREWTAGTTNTWGAWTPLGGVFEGGTTLSGAAYGGTLHVQGVNKDGILFETTGSGGTWSAWSPLNGVLSATPSLAATSSSLFTFDTNPAGALWYQQNTTSWLGWNGLDGILVTGPAATGAGGNAFVFGLNSDGNLWYRVWNGTSFSAWGNLGGILATA